MQNDGFMVVQCTLHIALCEGANNSVLSKFKLLVHILHCQPHMPSAPEAPKIEGLVSNIKS